MIFTKPNLLNGQTLIKELAQSGISVEEVRQINQNEIELLVDAKDKTKVESILKTHDGSDTIPAIESLRNSAISKLVNLGLTEDEAKAFLG